MPKPSRSGRPRPYRLLVVAHPDDETLFFGGLVLASRKKGPPWKIVCVTDGNADGLGTARAGQFAAAARALGVRDHEHWSFPDVYEKRLDVEALAARLAALPPPREIHTHGILGEYGHPHHQDVCAAVFKAFGSAKSRVPVWSVAYNCLPERLVKLTPAQYALKCKVLSTIYRAETRRFAHFLPATAAEGFVRLKASEVQALYAYLTGGPRPAAEQLKAYRWYWPYLEESGGRVAPRPF